MQTCNPSVSSTLQTFGREIIHPPKSYPYWLLAHHPGATFLRSNYSGHSSLGFLSLGQIQFEMQGLETELSDDKYCPHDYRTLPSMCPETTPAGLVAAPHCSLAFNFQLITSPEGTFFTLTCHQIKYLLTLHIFKLSF